MRNFLLILILIALHTSVLAAEVVGRFSPLNDNERFAYALERVPDAQGQWLLRLDMTMFAVRNNDINDTSELFTWEVANDSWGVHFTGDGGGPAGLGVGDFVFDEL